jgi:DNA topoisomerase I
MADLSTPGPSPVPGLRYVNDRMPGFRRRRAGSGFVYLGPDGDRIEDGEELARLRALVIPPAWTDVWICPVPNGHLQATGRDARGRKQYRYHDRWRAVRDETKFDRLAEFGRALTPIRRRVDRDIRREGLPREKVLAAVVRLMDVAFLRVGNAAYARENSSFGLTTLRNRHVDVRGPKVRFEFEGKGGKRQVFDIEDPRMAGIVRRCRDLPGYDLFQYLEDGRRQAVGSGDVNEYLREVSGADFTAKDFRTWAGTVMAARALADQGPASSERRAKRAVTRAVESVAARLGNTVAIARKSYVHPAVIEGYLDGSLLESWRRSLPERAPRTMARLRADEARLLRFLRQAAPARRAAS